MTMSRSRVDVDTSSGPRRSRRARLFCCAVAAAACLHGSVARSTATSVSGASFVVVPGVRFGPITERSSRRRLEELFPPASVRDAAVEIGEGLCVPGTRVLDGSANVVEIAWQDAARTRVAFVRTAGPAWSTPRGVRVGASLRALERLRGAALTFSGFGWDYGGRLQWREGQGELAIELTLDPRQPDASARAATIDYIQGDRMIRSDAPAVRGLPIVVGRLTMSWGGHGVERDCEQVAPIVERRTDAGETCARFGPVTVSRGQSLAVPIPGALTFSLRPDGALGWGLAVGPTTATEGAVSPRDFLWPASPPFQTAPHLIIGAGYGLTSEESAALPRDLRFVLTSTDYEAALAAASARPLDADRVTQVLARLRLGRLRLTVSDYRLAPLDDTPGGAKMRRFQWIALSGEACVPGN